MVGDVDPLTRVRLVWAVVLVMVYVALTSVASFAFALAEYPVCARRYEDFPNRHLFPVGAFVMRDYSGVPRLVRCQRYPECDKGWDEEWAHSTPSQATMSCSWSPGLVEEEPDEPGAVDPVLVEFFGSLPILTTFLLFGLGLGLGRMVFA